MVLRTIAGAAAAVCAAAALACGGDSSPTSPGGGGNNSPGPVGATITITASGVNPRSVTISAGQSITVTNNDARAHDISSNPHPVHNECPSLNVGRLSPGESRTSSAFTSARTCGYHDHDDPENGLWQGTVVVQ